LPHIRNGSSLSGIGKNRSLGTLDGKLIYIIHCFEFQHIFVMKNWEFIKIRKEDIEYHAHGSIWNCV